MAEGPDDEETRRLASGWGRRPERPARPPAIPNDADDAADYADAGAISGRAVTREPQELAEGDTLGGAAPADQGANDVPAEPGEPDDNLAQADPLSGNPPRRD